MQRTLLIYAPGISPRLSYTLQWIFTEQLEIPYRITTDISEWQGAPTPKINYSHEAPEESSIRILPAPLLQESNLSRPALSINRWKKSTILFYNQPGAVIPFDIFSAVFYLISRYEEYLPHQVDKHQRYQPEQSVAAQYAFLQQPVVDEWLFHFRKVLEKKYAFPVPGPVFRFQPSYDIDMAWAYLHKGKLRTAGGYIKDLLRFKWTALTERHAVLKGIKEDPYDSFHQLDAWHTRYNLHPLYFILLGSGGKFDKNTSPANPAMQSLVRHIATKYATGIHPSYRSHLNTTILQQEIAQLATITGNEVRHSRQHYIKFTLPETYKNLVDAGITDDYSMGYAARNGFRAGTSQSFLWYDLSSERVSTLRVHPFAFMEATNKFYYKHTPEEAFREWEQLFHVVKRVGGTFMHIWHNYTLGHAQESKGWAELYEKTLRLAFP